LRGVILFDRHDALHDEFLFAPGVDFRIAELGAIAQQVRFRLA